MLTGNYTPSDFMAGRRPGRYRAPADYQAPGWRSWHHHAAIAMLATPFIVEQRAACRAGLRNVDAARHRRDVDKRPCRAKGKDALVAGSLSGTSDDEAQSIPDSERNKSRGGVSEVMAGRM